MQYPLASRVVYAVGRVTTNGLSLLGTACCVARNRFATTKHVTSGDDAGLVLILNANADFLDYQDTSVSSVNYSTAHTVAIDPFRDICVLEIGGDIAPPYAIGSTDSVPPGSPVVTFGYPHANQGRWVLTQHETHVGARILIDNAGFKTKHVVLNTQARPGQSGGPVFDSSASQLVAMIVGSYAPAAGAMLLGGIDPQTLHQTTHAISAEYIREML